MAIFGRKRFAGFGDVYTDMGAQVLPFSAVVWDGELGLWRAMDYSYFGQMEKPGVVIFRNDAGSVVAVAYQDAGQVDTSAPSGTQPLGTFAYYAAERFQDPAWVSSKLAAAPQFAALQASDPGNAYFKIYGPFPVGGNDMQIMTWFAKVDYGGTLTAIAQDRADSEQGWEGFLDNTFPMLATSFVFGGAIGAWASATGAAPYGPFAAATDLVGGAIDSYTGIDSLIDTTPDAISATGGDVFNVASDYVTPYDADVVLVSGEEIPYSEADTILEGGVGPTFDLPADADLSIPTGGYSEADTILEGGVGPTFDTGAGATFYDAPVLPDIPIDTGAGATFYDAPVLPDIPIDAGGGEVIPVSGDEIPRVTITGTRPPDDVVWGPDGFTPTPVDTGPGGETVITDSGGGVTTGDVVKVVTALGPTIIRTVWPPDVPTRVTGGGGVTTVVEGGDDLLPSGESKSMFPWGLLIAAALALSGKG